MENKKRISNFELLRLIMMMLIIFSHYFTHGQINSDLSILNLVIWGLIGRAGSFAVLVFVLISGYFMSTSNFKFSKFLKLLFEYVFYNLVIYIFIQLLVLKNDFSITTFVKLLFPFYATGSPNWFITTYLVLYLLTPFINFLIKAMEKKIYIGLIITSVTIWFIVPMFTGATFGGNELITLISVYLIGAYFKKFPNQKTTANFSKKFFLIIMPCYMLFSVALSVVGTHVSSLSFLLKVSSLILSKNSILTLLVAISIFLLTLTSKPFYSKFINFIAGSTLAIYLIHDNLHFKKYMWQNIFNVQKHASSNLLILNIVWVSITIFSSCLLIDIARRYLFEKPIFSLLDKPISYIENYFNKKIDYFSGFDTNHLE